MVSMMCGGWLPVSGPGVRGRPAARYAEATAPRQGHRS